jgi:hypothetical protein
VITYTRWLTSRLFRSYLAVFPFIWILGKAANAFTAAQAGLPPYGFHFLTEVFVCVLELVVLATYLRRDNQDILLANLGLSLPVALAPLAALHFVLSGVAALLA